METKKHEVVEFFADKSNEWDEFVMNRSVNGTFLQTRRFLNYHDSGKFKDASFMVYNAKKHLVCVCPACEIWESNRKVCSSHQGSTFGGLVIDNKIYTAQKIIELVQLREDYLKQKGFEKIIYKITSDLFSREKTDLLRYSLYYNNYESYDELNLYIDLQNYGENILSNFSQGKRTNVHNCMRAGIEMKILHTQQEIEEFHEVLCETLGKYGLKPVHTVRELILFKEMILTNECEFFGLYKDNKMIAGAMMFYFLNVNVAHTQYLCARAEYNTLSPMTYMYYLMIVEAKRKNYKWLTWGITSEHYGKVLNFGLTKSKEAFGSKYSVSNIYTKTLGER